MSKPPPPPDEFINEFCQRLQRLLENSPLAGVRHMGEDGRENLRALGEALLGRMNAVSRAEFDEHNKILAEAVEKLAQLEEKLAQLEREGKGKAKAKAKKPAGRPPA